ncbi:MAG: DNA-directed DNA polymerase [Planctomycetota bacterium]|nr:MAG: DNA-directed DNA polymerase [Planctomycetota bacterium]
MSPGFVHLHVHSDYSLLDGACRHEPLLELCRSYGMPAVAVTDHGNLFGAMEFYLKARRAGIKPIIGCEIYTVPGDEPDAHRRKGGGAQHSPTHHLLLLCKDLEGWRNLSRLVSLGYLEGFYYKPRVCKALLRRYSRGLICTTACLQGEVCQHLLADRYDLARQSVESLREIFGEDNLYLEIQQNGLAEQRKVNSGLLELARELGLPLVATCDVHYLRPEDARAQDALVCINTGKRLDDPDRLRLEATLHFRSPAEAAEAFRGQEEALAATVAIAERCNLEFPTGRRHLPVYTPPPARPGGPPQDPVAFFEQLCRQGLARRYGTPLPAEVEQRYAMEREVIVSMGFTSYFLIVWDFIDWAKRQGIPVGPGRGSAAGSIVAYALGITDVCPLRYDLLFERFLNRERVSMPDIDVDICQERRGEVLEYVRQKYGRDAVSQIITFGTMAARSVIRDVGRVLGIPLAEVDRLAKLVPADLQVRRKKLRDALEEVPELREAIAADPRYAELMEIAEKLEGSVRNASTHACGVVIGDGPLIERVPLYRDPKNPDELVTQFSMGLLEEACGLLKMDFLGLRTLTVIRWCLDHIESTEGHRPDVCPQALPLDDPDDPTARKAYALLRRGETRGVFQFESAGYRDLLVRLAPDCFEDIIALGAMYRPGPLGAGMVDAYVARKHGRERVSYPHPALERILGETYGCMLYQEQVMRIANVLGGFTLNEADSLRKAMGKKKPEVMARFRDQFVRGAQERGCSQELAVQIWEQMEHFAGYGFNKSHSTAYAVLTFQTAWLKANYPVEFMAALLSSEAGTIDKVVEYIAEAERMGIAVLPPDVNASQPSFAVVRQPDGSKAIRYGLVAIRGVGQPAAEELVRARAATPAGRFASLFDLCAAVDTRLVNKATLEALIKAGATASLAGSRAQQMAVLEKALAHGARAAADRRAGQRTLFGARGAAPAPPPSPPLPEIPEWSEAELLQAEKEALGFYLSSHPLRRWRAQLVRYTTATSRTLARLEGEAILGGLVQQVRTRIDRRGNTMAFVTIEDLEGTVETVVFARCFAEHRSRLVPDAIVIVRGQVDTAREPATLLVEDVVPIEQADRAFAVQLTLQLRPEHTAPEQLEALFAALAAHPGGCPVICLVQTASGLRARIRLGAELQVDPGPALLQALAGLLGPERVRVHAAHPGRCAPAREPALAGS